MGEAHPCSTPMVVGTKLYGGDSDLFENPFLNRSTVGVLQYITLTRPDVSFVVSKLSQFLKAQTQLQWRACKIVLRYLKGTLSHGLLFKSAPILKIEAYSDTDWAGYIGDRRSTSGYGMHFGGNHMQWSSRKQKIVSLSSTESEYRTLSQPSTEVVWLRNLLDVSYVDNAIVWCDNVSVGLLASNSVLHSRMKHIELDIHFVRIQTAAEVLAIQSVSFEFQVADVLIKVVSATRFCELKERLNVLELKKKSEKEEEVRIEEGRV